MSDALCLVLVIDRDRCVFLEVERALDGLSVAVSWAADRASGLSRCRELLPNVVLLDASLDDPRFPLHDLFGDSGVDVVLVAADSTQVSVPEAIARGASEILTKPLDSARLREAVSAFSRKLKRDGAPGNWMKNCWRRINSRVWSAAVPLCSRYSQRCGGSRLCS